ncbi:MAG: GNAT family N-acetyltransferase [Deltaproteobacteria bacterium]|nr:GNAT family N-acetyltransferase [Deltaproteobacteria bacterium]
MPLLDQEFCMSIATRPATAEDAPFLAWVIQAAARSHLELGIWDLALPGPDAPRLEFLATLAVTDQAHFAHFSRFRVLEVDGVPAAGLSAYENSEHGMEKLALGLVEASRKLAWTQQKLERTIKDTGSFNATGYPSPDGLWIVEWVATRPEFRGRSFMNRMLLEILDEGRALGFERAQIGHLLGNTPARAAYERVGFVWLEDHCHPDFERDYGEPGLARMQRDL